MKLRYLNPGPFYESDKIMPKEAAKGLKHLGIPT